MFDTNKLDSYIERAKKIREAATETEAGALLYSIIREYIDAERLDSQRRRLNMDLPD